MPITHRHSKRKICDQPKTHTQRKVGDQPIRTHTLISKKVCDQPIVGAYTHTRSKRKVSLTALFTMETTKIDAKLYTPTII